MNQYEANAGHFTSDEILALDDKLISEKRNNFTSAYKNSGNIAGAYIDGGEFYLAHSGIDDMAAAKKYKGSENIVILKTQRSFEYIDVPQKDGTMRTNTYYDTEAKLLEHFEALYSSKPFKSLVMISERGMCDSCKGVMQQFMSRHPEVVVKAVSNKKVVGDVWKYRRKRKK